MAYNKNRISLEEEIASLRLENNKLKADIESLTKMNECCIEIRNGVNSWIRCNQKEFDNNLYKEIFKSNLSIMLLIDPETGDIVDANEAAVVFYGYRLSELRDKKISDINLLSQNEIRKQMRKALKTKINKFYFNHRLANGDIREVSVTSSPILLNEKKYLCSIIYDVTERNRNNELLNISEKKFKQLFNNANDALLVFRIDEQGMPSNFLEVNNEACHRLGYTYEEILELSPLDIDGFEEERIIQKIREMQKSNITNFRTVHVTKDKKRIPVEINTHFFELFQERAILVVARDIRARKEMERELRNSLEKQERILAFIPAVILIVRNHKIQYINEYGRNLLGYSLRDDLIGKEYLSIVHPRFHSIAKNRISDLEKEDIVTPLIEQEYIKRNGEIVFVEVTGQRITYENQHAILAYATNISEKKRVEIQLAEKNYFEKLRTDFFANISHELRTPLNVILGSLQLQNLYLNVNEDLRSSDIERYKKFYERMKRNCYRLLRLVNNLLDISKIDAGFYSVDFQNYDIVFLVKRIVISVKDYVKKQNLTIQLKTNIDTKIIACDPEKIERIMLNLLSNAIKFTESKGKIEVSISLVDEEIVISIKDSGIGIPEEKLNDIFERFVQVDKSLTRKHEGSGIGLSLVKSLIEMQDGRISVISSEKEGSEFSIKLPLRTVNNVEAERHSALSYEDFNIERMHIEFSDIYSK